MPPIIGTNAVAIPSKDKYNPLLRMDKTPIIINTQPIIFMMMIVRKKLTCLA